jgi:hypothetical protein
VRCCISDLVPLRWTSDRLLEVALWVAQGMMGVRPQQVGMQPQQGVYGMVGQGQQGMGQMGMMGAQQFGMAQPGMLPQVSCTVHPSVSQIYPPPIAFGFVAAGNDGAAAADGLRHATAYAAAALTGRGVSFLVGDHDREDLE